MKINKIFLALFFLLVVSGMYAQPNYDYSKLKMENLGRGVVAIKKDASTNFLSWRYLRTDPMNIAFNVYRNGQKINQKPVTKTWFEDKVNSSNLVEYTVESLVKSNKLQNNKQSCTLPTNAPIGYINIPLDVPKNGVTPDGKEYYYNANDASIGDANGDGEYEIFLKWDPSNSHDNAHDGYTGNVLIDCYKLDGTKLWRIDLGKNIRAGAHYTQFMVYDLDSDGKAEIVMKTADGTIDGKGKIIGDPNADWREKGDPAQPKGGDFGKNDPRSQTSDPAYPPRNQGRILSGPEYLSVFSGETGEEIHTIDYIPPRGDGSLWGDNRGNRSDRFLAAVAYLDGENPSVVMCRGYYTRAVLAAFDFKNKKLTLRWMFDSNTPGNEGYAGQGNHNLRVGDVDGDGKDEIIYGACAIDDNGAGLWTTGKGHGDAEHLTVFDPRRKGMQIWDVHENRKDGSTFLDAATGETIFQVKSNIDVGRGMAADIDPRYFGVEMWSWESGGIRDVEGNVINSEITQKKIADSIAEKLTINMAVWWDGDLSRELLDKNNITKYDYETGTVKLLFQDKDLMWNNGTKSNPALQGDICGDWREEAVWRTKDNKNLRVYVSTIPTDYKFHTFVQEPVYRISMATQNVAYNQPTQPGFYFGTDLGKIFKEKDLVVEGNSVTLNALIHYDSYSWKIGGKIIGNGFSQIVTTKDIKPNKKTRIELAVLFRGQEFKDYVYLTFKK